jgi:serine/threonine protein kinase
VPETSPVSNVAGSLLAPGTTVAGYRIEALIGRGGMGAVYRAVEHGLERKVALKVIAPELAQDERFRERFLRESRIAASLDHPHIVPIYGAGEEEGVLYLAMRYVEGYDLAKLVAENGALEPRRAVDLLSQIAEALDAAHEKGLVHRDVKPSNVLVAEAGGREHCYLGDFGLTKRTGSLSGVTAVGEVVGTLEYVAPEQITGDPLDERADVYSLACVLYECLTGQAPFPRATDVALLWAHVHEEPTPPSEARPGLPKELDTVLARGLAKEPGRRYRSAGELLAATRSALRLVEAPITKTPQSRTRIGIAAALALLVIVAVAGYLLTRGSSGLSSVSPDSVGVIDPGSNRLVGEVAVGKQPGAITTGAGAVWIVNEGDKTVMRIDPQDTTARPDLFTIDGFPTDVTVGAGDVWVALGPSGEVARINPEQNEATSPRPALSNEIPCGGPFASIAFGGGYAWFVCRVPGEMGQIDPRTLAARSFGYDAGLLTSGQSVTPEYPDVAYGLQSLWLVNRAGNRVVPVDPLTTKKQDPISVGTSPTAVAVGEGVLWVANFGSDTVTRLTVPAAGAAPTSDSFPVGDGPIDVAVGEGAVWVANQLDRTVMRLDPESGHVDARISVGNEPQRLAAGEGSVWVTVRAPEDDNS